MVEIELTRAVLLGVAVGFISLFFPLVARIADAIERTQRLIDLIAAGIFLLGLVSALLLGGISIAEFSEAGITYLAGLLAEYLLGLVIGVVAGALVAVFLSPFKRYL